MIRLVAMARARRWWRAWLGIAVLVSITGGAVLASSAAARRTQAALPQFASAYGADVAAFALKPAASTVAGLPGVMSSYQLALPQTGPATCRGCRGPARPLALDVYSPAPAGWPGWKLLSGRWPDPADPRQVLASFTLRDDLGVQPGTVLRVPFYAAAQLRLLDKAGGPPVPAGPVVSFVVTGIAAGLQEFPAGVSPVHDLVTTPAFTRAVLPRTAAVYQYPIRLRGGRAGVGQFAAALRSPAVTHAGVAGYLNLADQVAAVTATTVFGASLSHLLATPALYGQQFQLNFSSTGGTVDSRVLHELQRDPALLGVVLAGFGAAMVAHLLVVSVARRRRELSLLKVLGFARGQVAGTVGWQATTLAVAGLAAGLPLGLAAGQALWRAFAVSFGVVAVPVAPPGLLAALAAAVLVAANLLAAGPAIAAARARPGPVLRAP